MAETLSVVAVADPPFAVQNGQPSSAPAHPFDSFFIFKDKVCSSTGGVNSVAECKTTQEDLDSLASEEDNCRKKRCADRYDSSESSDSGVAVHCGDCGSSNSDITEPCSPLSTTSLEEMPPTQTQPSWPWSDGDPPSKRPKQGKITEYFKSKTKKLFQSSPKPGFESDKEMSLMESSVTEFLSVSPSETPDFLVTPPLSREEDDDERSPPSLESSSSSTSSSDTSLKKDDHFWQTDIVAELIRRSTESKEKEENKNIRFPLKNGWRGHYVSDIICRWSDCHAKFNTTSALIEHLQVKHVNSQTLKEYFMCQWVDCKVFERKSCSRTWLERHVLSHGGNKPYRCIVDGCGHRFSSQTLLQKHVNNHFSERDQKGDSKKGCEQNSKLIRRNGKKLRYRRQPLSARIYDYFDAGVMVGLQHNLIEITEKRTQGKFDSCPGDSIVLHSKVMGRRTDLNGASQVLLRWFPTNIINDEWILADKAETTRTIKIPTLPVQSKDCLNSYLLNHQRLRPTRTGRKRTTATAT